MSTRFSETVTRSIRTPRESARADRLDHVDHLPLPATHTSGSDVVSVINGKMVRNGPMVQSGLLSRRWRFCQANAVPGVNAALDPLEPFRAEGRAEVFLVHRLIAGPPLVSGEQVGR
jgi:hypothetical protein